jgi:hypothetical protein
VNGVEKDIVAGRCARFEVDGGRPATSLQLLGQQVQLRVMLSLMLPFQL